MPFLATFIHQDNTIHPEENELLVGISLGQEYHQNFEKVSALLALIARHNFKAVHVVVPGELYGITLMLNNKDLSLTEARQEGRRRAEQWVTNHKELLGNLSKCTISYYDEVLTYGNFAALHDYVNSLRDQNSQNCDPKFIRAYDRTKGIFISHHMARLAEQNSVPDQNEFTRICRLIENYLDGELVQFLMWAEEKRPYNYIAYPKNKPPVVEYIYENLLKKIDPESMANRFVDLIYAIDPKGKSSQKIKNRILIDGDERKEAEKMTSSLSLVGNNASLFGDESKKRHSIDENFLNSFQQRILLMEKKIEVLCEEMVFLKRSLSTNPSVNSSRTNKPQENVREQNQLSERKGLSEDGDITNYGNISRIR